MLKNIILTAVTTVLLTIFLACNPKTVKLSSNSNSEQLTPECQMQKEVCEEALDFQKEYNRLPEKEQKDMKAVLNSYVEHCEDSKAACEKSK